MTLLNEQTIVLQEENSQVSKYFIFPLRIGLNLSTKHHSQIICKMHHIKMF